MWTIICFTEIKISVLIHTPSSRIWLHTPQSLIWCVASFHFYLSCKPLLLFDCGRMLLTLDVVFPMDYPFPVRFVIFAYSSLTSLVRPVVRVLRPRFVPFTGNV